MTSDPPLSIVKSLALKDSPSSDEPANSGGVTIVHIALQGCLKSGGIDYGRMADTGGHIRYLLELVGALSERPEVARQIIVTRGFRGLDVENDYDRATEQFGDGVELWRCFGDTDQYLAKEDLWPELPTLARNLERRLCRSAIWPDIIHAHYADAGWVAGQLKAHLGIPFIFTSHSLGLVKAKTRNPADEFDRNGGALDPALRRRVDIEQYAISQSDVIIASSDDEVVNQYGLYAGQIADKCEVNPPGCNLALFAQTAPALETASVVEEMARFLKDPQRRVLMALARPVVKKNLVGLLHAYGKSPELRARANLVIWAGTRDDVGKGDDEASAVLNELIYLIDLYDLYGCVALPKTHSVEQVPAIYQWTARRRGIFVNVALNEPFGLTLLEAAASGLPVVATRSGGPRDIVADCRHGLLVDPECELAITCAALTLLQNDALYDELRRNGLERVRHYRWSRHVHQYLDVCDPLLRPKRISNQSTDLAVLDVRGKRATVLATDLDATILGSPAGVRAFATWRASAPDWLWVVATGRNPDVAIQLLKAAGAPLPDYLIAAVGTELYQVSKTGTLVADTSWAEKLAVGWERATCDELLRTFPGVIPQESLQQRPFKLSYRIVGDSVTADQVRRLLHRESLHANVVQSHQQLLDVVAPRASKGLAVRHLSNQLDNPPSCVIAAGDSGNDLSLIASADAGIVVANHNGELESLRALSHVYWCRKSFAAGVLEGVRHFNGGQDPVPQTEKTASHVF